MKALGTASRRALLAGVASFASLVGRPGFGQGSDRGIGGTGVAPEAPAAPVAPGGDDRGIGGTGVIGTIRRFGSIYVNGLRIAYPKDVPVTIDGAPATAAALRLGHVVSVVARRRGNVLQTGRIVVESEVIGPIASRTAQTLTVLGQTVSVAGLAGATAWQPGTTVAVGGLRRPDGTIVASIVERRDGAAPRVAGPVREVAGETRIGNLALRGLDPNLVGSRAAVQGNASASGLDVAQAARVVPPSGPGIQRLSIEDYVERRPGGVRTGSGFDVVGGARSDLPARGVTRAVFDSAVGPGGQIRIERLRLDPGIGGGSSGGERSGRGGDLGGGRGGPPGGGIGDGLGGPRGGIGDGIGGRRGLGEGPGGAGGAGGLGGRSLPLDMRGGPGGGIGGGAGGGLPGGIRGGGIGPGGLGGGLSPGYSGPGGLGGIGGGLGGGGGLGLPGGLGPRR